MINRLPNAIPGKHFFNHPSNFTKINTGKKHNPTKGLLISLSHFPAQYYSVSPGTAAVVSIVSAGVNETFHRSLRW